MRNSEISRIIGWICGQNGFGTPSFWIEVTNARITSETLARKLRAYSKGDNPIILKKQYRNGRNEEISVYGPNKAYKEKK